MIQIRIIPGIGDTTEVFAIRRKVFIEEQGFSAVAEFDVIDREALHALVLLHGQPAATARLFERGGQWHIGRVAVLKEHRGGGLGQAAMRMLMQKAADFGASEVLVGAQRRAQGFYEALGFTPCGPEYDEEGVLHVPMKAPASTGCACKQCETAGE